MKIIAIWVIAIFLPLFWAGCLFNDPIDTIILEKPIEIDGGGLTINCNPPLKRKFNSAAIHIETVERCQVCENNELKCSDGLIANLQISLIDSNGKTINTQYYGNAGYSIVGFFSEISKKTKIKAVKIISSKKISVKKVSWHQFDPI